MSVLNPSFEDAGLLPGEAAGWTLVSVTSREAIAGFGTNPEVAWEDFERWSALLRTLEDVSVARAFFDVSPEGVEDFGENWENNAYTFTLSPGLLRVARFGPDDAESEDCERGWDNDPYATRWSEVDASAGSFGGEPREDFEARWRDNQDFAWTWDAVLDASARFDADAVTAETFDGAWDAAVAT